MNFEEAKKILGLSGDPTEDEIKKAFRKKAAQFHPDRNKDPGAEDQFKKINQANQVLTNPQPEPHFGGGNPFGGQNPFDAFFNVGFGGFQQQRQKQHHAPPINLSLNLSFAESILGTKKTIEFHRTIRCEDCQGQGSKTQGNGCDKCGGKGTIIQQQGQMVFSRTCDKCHGRKSPSIPCKPCDESGVKDSQVKMEITIPGGVSNGNAMRLGGAGNYAGNFGMASQSSDVFVELKVASDPDLRLEEEDDEKVVVCNLEISLLEAFEGCEKTVRTVKGEEKISVPPMTKHKDMVRIKEAGINYGKQKGDQRVDIGVQYPEDVSELVSSLKAKQSKTVNWSEMVE